ncbi:acylphosphatase [Herbiconiux sp. CPCC 205763]|uniref:acylphosphatase n=1 Tax=Herbiconiux aconitum TaxID=2970913 RepID=A0ABT2GUG8_9MICO|nr:acylphosphatase [Herbiconiux aconitum]MCS5719828.1 acylphosphatase [Herbiconiux aconitum]
MIHRRVVVRGEVQGVGYRWATREHALALGISGYVQNLRDGSVLAELEGEAGTVEAMVEWMRSGPPGAGVASVEVVEVEVEASGATEASGPFVPSGFEIRR